MATIITDLRDTFRRGSIYIQLIYINVAVFVAITLAGVMLQLFNAENAGGLFLWLELPASPARFLMQPWSLLTYMFMHGGLLHILFNMLWLYWFGALFLNVFSAKHLRGLYILGGICGGILYMAAYNVFPYFRDAVPFSYLLGASASVLSVGVATAVREPDYPVQFLFIGTVRLKYVALFMVALDLLFLTADNAGGHLAHLGGALAGWWFASELVKGRDLTRWINIALDCCSGRWHRAPRKPKMEVHYGDKQKDYEFNERKKARTDEIDRILDKLRKSGYGSLTEEEKKSLFDASEK